ncbi:MAG TPA: ABC transporter permease [Nocardioidaceae bacterium]|nr:ABC transporter permease [Nocardioidaceae bacterium]
MKATLTPTLTLSLAMWRGFLREKMAIFFVLLFPLMFLVLFGGIFSDQGQSKGTLIEVGEVPMLAELSKPARTALEDAYEIEHSGDLAAALDQVQAGDVDGAVEQHGDEVVVHFSEADQVAAATLRGTISALVQGANVASTGEPPRYSLVSQQVEDESLQTIQYVTPGLLGWAIAMSATFGAAMTLVEWRRNKLLRRLRLAPISTGSLVSARILVSVGTALLQLVVFVGLATAAFGLKLTGAWPMAVPLLICGTLSFMAIGLLAGAVSKTSEGASGLANLVILPMAFLSGSFIPLDASPQWLQTVSRVLPLRYLNEGMLDVMVRGQGAAAALLPMLVLLGFALVIGVVATRLFRWEAD